MNTSPSLFFKKTFPKGPKVAVYLTSDKEGKTKIQLFTSQLFTAFFPIQDQTLFHEKLLIWLSLYSEGKKLPFLNLPRQNLPVFTSKVLDVMESIAFGKTLSYGEIAGLAGSENASRAVGTICRLNPWPLFIPCHRVLPKKAIIGKYAFGSEIKKALLTFERGFQS